MERDFVWFVLGLLSFASMRGTDERTKEMTSLARPAANIVSAVCLAFFAMGFMMGGWGMIDLSPLLQLAGLSQIGLGLYVGGVRRGWQGW